MAGGREKLLARSSRSKNKVLVSKEKEPGIRKAVESNMGQFGVNEVYATPEPGIQPRNPQSCQHSAVSNHLWIPSEKKTQRAFTDSQQLHALIFWSPAWRPWGLTCRSAKHLQQRVKATEVTVVRINSLLFGMNSDTTAVSAMVKLVSNCDFLKISKGVQ